MSHFSLPIVAVHPAPPVGGVTSPSNPIATELTNTAAASVSTNVTTLSFAFDRETKSLRVVITDQVSGEVLRKLEYAFMPPQTHQIDKLQGLLLDQLA